jgi:hypothetical protein
MSQLTRRGAGRSDNNVEEKTPYPDASMAEESGQSLGFGQGGAYLTDLGLFASNGSEAER